MEGFISSKWWFFEQSDFVVQFRANTNVEQAYSQMTQFNDLELERKKTQKQEVLKGLALLNRKSGSPNKSSIFFL